MRATAFGILLAALSAPAGFAPLFGAENEGALIHGIIYRSDEATRLQGALVTAINVRTGRRYSSIHTGANGAYEIAGLPAGTYDIAIDTPDDNLYVTDGLIDLHENQRLMLSLSLKKSGGAVPGGPARGEPTQSFTDPGAVPPTFAPGAATPLPPAAEASGGKSDKKPEKKPKKPVGTKAKTGSGATATLRLEPASSFPVS
ncbi:MAG TPA: carboxypeptidase-like regulatory domain-containing protein [Candidatus Polarisedimenticolia bacterium]|nr:carboxypeptidase-like regulatory domain-containing protein [Candidatus Polarisedimenticolia bacterium]